ncbi:MAG: sulfite exporter TauE/SafE family protein [Candidatus Cyclobacteriaceae bacterium M3_2C_046]
MSELIQSFDLTTYQWILMIFCGLLVGMGKTGIAGVGLLVVPLLAAAFGGKDSAGLLLPMLAIADVFAVVYYNRHARWKYVLRLLPSALVGILLGLYVGEIVNDDQFKEIMAIIILVSLGIMIWREQQKNINNVPDQWWFSILIGLAGGFATMIGNAAGPIMAVYFLSMRLPKNNFIGTGAWFFLIVNYFKIPFHIIVWNTISSETFSLNVAMFPFIMLGAYLGVKIVKRIPERPYRIFVIVMTAVAALRLFF